MDTTSAFTLTEDLFNVRGKATHRAGETLTQQYYQTIRNTLCDNSALVGDLACEALKACHISKQLQHLCKQAIAGSKPMIKGNFMDSMIDRLLIGYRNDLQDDVIKEYYPMNAVMYVAFAFYGRKVSRIDEKDSGDIEILGRVIDYVVERFKLFVVDVDTVPFFDSRISCFTSTGFENATTHEQARMVRVLMNEIKNSATTTPPSQQG